VDWCLIADVNATLSWVWMIGSVAVGLGLVIFVHELGHFLAAKACGVKVEKFYVGFDIPMGPLPSTLLKFRRGETEYGIGILPLGGYVKMLGQDDNPRNQAKENERIKIHKGSPASAESDDNREAAEVTAETVDRAGPEPCCGQVGDGAGEFEWDPRSYPAKPVWQRMIIISAGVVMNLIFAVIFSAIAYSQGVTYLPCIVGGAAPGDPAWVAGLQGGDKILQIGRHGKPDEQLRFDKDLMIDVTLHGAKRPLDLLIRRAGETEPQWISLTPTDRLADSDRPATLGIPSAATTILVKAATDDSSPGSDGGYAQLQTGDEIVAVDGQTLPRDPRTGLIFEHELDRLLASRMTAPVRLTIRRPAATQVAGGAATSGASPQTLDVTIPPTQLRTTGLVMEPGPVIGVRKNSPAEAAGFREGDVLVSVAGEDLGDPLTLRQRLLALVGTSVEFGVRREGVSAPVRLRATPVVPTSSKDGFSPGSPIGIESLGLAFHLTNVVKEVVPGSPAEKAGLRAGDKLTGAQFTRNGQKDGAPLSLVKGESSFSRLQRWLTGQPADASVVGKDRYNWYFVNSLLNLVPEYGLELTYHRGEELEETISASPLTALVSLTLCAGIAWLLVRNLERRRWLVFALLLLVSLPIVVALSTTSQESRPVALEPVYSGQFFHPARHLHTQSLSLVRKAESWSEAWALGYIETEVSVKKVLAVLQRLFTGKLSYRSLGGPIMIVQAAGSEASEGVARLLVFLTFLSANLAVLNFLPIPALDGGHMLFLAAEGIRGKPVNERLQVALTLIGVGCLLSLMVLVFGLDIQRFF